MTNLARLYTAQKRYSEAETLLLEALTIRKKNLGDDHPYIANALAYLAKLYSSQGDNSQARPLYVQALEIRERRLGSTHPDTVKLREELASCLRQAVLEGGADLETLRGHPLVETILNQIQVNLL